MLVDAWVNQDHLFDSHDPLTLKFDVSLQSECSDAWKLPRSWTVFNVPHAIVSDAYDQALDAAMQDNVFDFQNPDWTFDEAIQSWSHVAEQAVSHAIARHHAIDSRDNHTILSLLLSKVGGSWLPRLNKFGLDPKA